MRQCQCLLRRCDSTSRYVRSPLHCGISAPSMSALGRLCCKSPKLPGDKILAIRRTNRRPPIYAASVTLPSSPASSSSGNEVPHIFTRKSRLQPGEFLVTSAKRLLQQYRHQTDLSAALNHVCSLRRSGLKSEVAVRAACDPTRTLAGDSDMCRKPLPVLVSPLQLLLLAWSRR